MRIKMSDVEVSGSLHVTLGVRDWPRLDTDAWRKSDREVKHLNLNQTSQDSPDSAPCVPSAIEVMTPFANIKSLIPHSFQTKCFNSRQNVSVAQIYASDVWACAPTWS